MAESVRSSLLGIFIFIACGVLMYVFRKSITAYLSGLSGYLGISIVSFIGALSVLVPIPYTAIVLMISVSQQLNPLLVSLAGGLGSGLGEFTGWVLGRLLGKLIENSRYSTRLNTLMNFVEHGPQILVSIFIFLFALTPLPDDLLFIILGVLRYSLIKALIPCILGKIVMFYILTTVGSFMWRLGEVAGLSEDQLFVLTLVMLLILLMLVLFIPWDNILDKYMKKLEVPARRAPPSSPHAGVLGAPFQRNL